MNISTPPPPNGFLRSINFKLLRQIKKIQQIRPNCDFLEVRDLSHTANVIARPGRQKPRCATVDTNGIKDMNESGENCRYGNTLFLV
jgi:hypothetical protein